MRRAIACFGVVVSGQALAAPAVLERVELVHQPRLAIHLRLSAPVRPLGRALAPQGSAPARVYLDLPATLGSGVPSVVPGDGVVLRLRTGQFQPGTARVVVDLARPVSFAVRADGTSVMVELGEAPGGPPVATSAPPVVAAPATLRATTTTTTTMRPTTTTSTTTTTRRPTTTTSTTTTRPTTTTSSSTTTRPTTTTTRPPTTTTIRATTTTRPPTTSTTSSTSTSTTSSTSTSTTAPPPPPAAKAPPATPPNPSPPRTAAVPGPPLARLVVIDAGHGGRDPGAAGVGGVLEKDIVLELSRLLTERLLARLPVSVLLTRSDDSFVPIEQRVALPAEGAALFISLHANACADRSARGLEVFYGGGAMRTASTPQPSPSAAVLGQAISRALAARIGGVRGAARPGDFGVLLRNPVPSTLVEIGYLTHPDEAARAQDTRYQELLADALVDGVADFLRASTF